MSSGHPGEDTPSSDADITDDTRLRRIEALMRGKSQGSAQSGARGAC